ncbi:MAG: cytochrome c [Hyphomicrobiales bacterium]|nr:cytochrome c [Hyphomicrobiales bacterium]
MWSFVRGCVGPAALAAGLVAGSLVSAAASEKGKQLYVKHGCWQCHGFVGQGGIAGPALVPEVMPLDAMSNFIRNANRAMPPYREAVLSDGDLKEIHAFLASVPKPTAPGSIPLLSQ